MLVGLRPVKGTWVSGRREGGGTLLTGGDRNLWGKFGAGEGPDLISILNGSAVHGVDYTRTRGGAGRAVGGHCSCLR